MSLPHPAHYQTLEFAHVNALMADWRKAQQGRLRVLDFGCGKGKFLHHFAALGDEVVGVDTNPAYVQEALAKGIEAYDSADFFTTNLAPFDVIFLSHLVEHLTPEQLVSLIPRLSALLAPTGRLIIISPTFGERFYHDFSHTRPFLPQSIRHAFGQTGAPISFGETTLITLVDIYFFKDPYKTRSWRSFYFGHGLKRVFTRWLNRGFDLAWQLSGGRIGVTASWLGVYQNLPRAG